MIESLLISLKLAGITTLLLLLLSVPISYILAFKSFRFKVLLEASIMLPVLLPPTVLGFYLILALSPESPLGTIVEKLTGGSLLFNFWGLVLGSMVYSLPFGVLPIRDSFSSVDERYIHTAYVFGYSRLETFFKVVIPNSWNGIITAAALVFARTVGEFGVVLMVGGNIPGETRTLSILIYDEVQTLNYSDAHKASLLLLASSLLSLSAILMFRKRLGYDRSKL